MEPKINLVAYKDLGGGILMKKSLTIGEIDLIANYLRKKELVVIPCRRKESSDKDDNISSCGCHSPYFDDRRKEEL